VNLQDKRLRFSVLGAALLAHLALESLLAGTAPYLQRTLAQAPADFLITLLYIFSFLLPAAVIFSVLSDTRSGEKAVCKFSAAELGGIISVVGMCFLAGMVSDYTVRLLKFAHVGITSSSAEYTSSVNVFLFSFVQIVILAPILEEFLFRRAVMRVLLPAGKGSAVVLGALFFALAHKNPRQILHAFIAGLFLGALFLKYGLKTAIIAHFCNNLISFAASAAGELTDPLICYTVYKCIGYVLGALALIWLWRGSDGVFDDMRHIWWKALISPGILLYITAATYCIGGYFYII